MKVNNGLLQLLIVITIMVAGLPLLSMLMRQCQLSKFNYLDDKTTYTLDASIDYREVTSDAGTKTYIPVNLSCLTLDYGAAIALAHVNDDYCPNTGRVVTYAFNSGHILDKLNLTNKEAKTLRIVDNWDAHKYNEYNDIITHVNTNSNKSNYGNKELYLVWNSRSGCWVTTSNFINIYGYSSDSVNKHNTSGDVTKPGWREIN